MSRSTAEGLVQYVPAIQEIASKHPKSDGVKYSYGTAGFRMPAEHLDSVILRMGMLAALRSRCFKENNAVGGMITASHNQEPDNGLKLVDPSGGMMETAWEKHATELANAAEDEVSAVLEKIVVEHDIDPAFSAKVFMGRDTRATSDNLANLFSQGATTLGAEVIDLGIVCTPQVHWVVREHNNNRPHTVADYHQVVADAFLEIVGTEAKLDPVIVDCANGVGAASIEKFQPLLESVLPIEIRNRPGDGDLNSGVGAEHVQKQQKFPAGFDSVADRSKKCCSVDGDADRIVYFQPDEEGNFRLFDGDKITALCAQFLQGLLKDAEIELNIGVVQTAYANGASTRFIGEELGVEVSCVPTGVKFIHHKAEEYDIGVYFEANGHGTVLFSDKAVEQITAAAEKEDKKESVKKLAAMTRMVNQAIGDAASDMLLVEAVLASRQWTLTDWNNMYTDLPSKQSKVKVSDRTLMKTADAERKCVEPAGLQDKLDTLISEAGEGARAFVRPSGTEDVVRIYAEGTTTEAANDLAAKVADAIVEFMG